MVVTTILFAHTNFRWATCCLICFIPIVKPFLTHWSWLGVVPFIERGNRAHGRCDQSTGDAYSSMARDPTSDIFRGPCTPILICISYGTYEIDYWSLFLSFLNKVITQRLFSFPDMLAMRWECRFCRFHSWSTYLFTSGSTMTLITCLFTNTRHSRFKLVRVVPKANNTCYAARL
jgi:hypothetical protein